MVELLHHMQAYRILKLLLPLTSPSTMIEQYVQKIFHSFKRNNCPIVKNIHTGIIYIRH